MGPQNYVDRCPYFRGVQNKWFIFGYWEGKLCVPKSLLILCNQQMVSNLPDDALVQCWFRMLHTLGNPVEVSYASAIVNTPSFKQLATELGSGGPESVSRHQCLEKLPSIFQEAMRGVATLVALFLGVDDFLEEQQGGGGGGGHELSAPSTPLTGRHSPHTKRKERQAA